MWWHRQVSEMQKKEFPDSIDQHLLKLTIEFRYLFIDFTVSQCISHGDFRHSYLVFLFVSDSSLYVF